jgi:surfeit locus 1 family protein
MNRAQLIVRTLFNRRWWWVTLCVLALMGVLARLGVWQLDRLAERRASNAELRAALMADPLDLNRDPVSAEIPEGRRVVATGVFDLDAQMLLKVQSWQGQPGIHLITPLVLADGATAVLVDRGWIPDAQANATDAAAYDVTGLVTVEGAAAKSQMISRGAAVEPSGSQFEWYRVDVAAIQRQMPYELLPIYVRQAPPPEGNLTLPYRSAPEIDLSEGSHLSYALQWFIFSMGLGIAYVIFVNKNTP